MNFNSRKFREQKESRTNRTADSCVCLVQTMKEIAGDHTVRFIINPRPDIEMPIEISGDDIVIDNQKHSEDYICAFIGKYRKDIEGLFLEAAKKQGIQENAIRKLYIAKLADASGKNNLPAQVFFNTSDSKVAMQITREGNRAVFRLGGKLMAKEEAEAFICDHYTDFLIGYKAAVKSTSKKDVQDDIKKKEKSAEKRRAAGIVTSNKDGKLEMDISGIIGYQKEVEDKKRSKKAPAHMLIGEQVLKPERKGYVPD